MTLATACHAVLTAPDPRTKIMLARRTARDWRLGKLAHTFDTPMPDAPARPPRPELLPPSRMPKRGKAGSLRNRIALLHALAHIEFSAIDLAFDLVGRFGAQFPRGFADDWLRVGADEAIHFALLDRRLRQLGSHYGALPAHDGLWEAAEVTRDDALARLAVVPMVLEARGLDVTPATADRLTALGDGQSARILQRIFNDEIRHVRAGTAWFLRACESSGFAPHAHWRLLISRNFRGALKPPFNDSARAAAGLTRDFYGVLDPHDAAPQTSIV